MVIQNKEIRELVGGWEGPVEDCFLIGFFAVYDFKSHYVISVIFQGYLSNRTEVFLSML